jgi:CYTH domain-containing protein/CHAD domain-containing protein
MRQKVDPALTSAAMAQEIERKFLLDEPPEWLGGRVGTRIEQGYLALDGEVEVRLRRRGEERLLTVKGGSGEVRQEVELALGAEEFELLWPLTGSRRLTKTRRLVSVGNGLEAEVDVYEGELAGLVVAEVEFGSERESREFTPPGWLGREVTGDGRYANQRLASEGAPASGGGENGKGKAMAYRFKRRERVDDGIRRIAAGRAEDALSELSAARSDGDLAEAIHSARKDMKKLRAVLRLVRKPLGKEFFRAENHRYRDAARLLSQTRDAEVKLETLGALRECFAEELPAGPAQAWCAALEAERDEIAGAGEDELAKRIERAIATIGGGRDEVREWPLRGDSWELIAAGLSRSYRQGRRELKRIRRDPSAENVHRWRKRVKDLWYQLRLVRKAWPELLGETVERTHELADLLGDHHDLTVLAEDLAERDELDRRQELTALIERRQGELLEAALELGARLFAERPKAFRSRIEGYWVAWRASTYKR